LIAAYAETKTLLDTASLNDDFTKQYGAGGLTAGGNRGYENYQLGGSYTLGAVTFSAGYSYKRDKSASSALFQSAKELYFGGVAYQFSPVSKLTVAYYDYNNKTAANAKSKMTSAQYIYSLSKRTDVYGIAAVMDNSSGAALTVGENSNIYSAAASSNTGVSPATGKDQTGFMVGIRHKF